MVGHEAVCVADPLVVRNDALQDTKELFPIVIGEKDILPGITPTGHMAKGVRIFFRVMGAP